MNEKQGTPKSLTEAVENALGPDFDSRQVEQICKHVQDYLAQKFSIAMFGDIHNEVNFRQLFLKCISRKE